jgi:SAM-dependent methyltransferase
LSQAEKKSWDGFWRAGLHQATRLTALNEKLVANILSLGSMGGKRILEVGAGLGSDSEYLAGLGAVVTLVDFSREALSLVQGRGRDEAVRLSLVEADARLLPFAGGTFDIVFHQGFLEHFRDPVPLLEEQRRILRPGGHLIADVPQKYSLFTVRKKVRMRQGRWIVPWETQYSINGLEATLGAAGFEIVRGYAWGMGLSFGRMPARLVRRLRGIGRPKNPKEAVAARRPESPRIFCYLADCIGVVAKKPDKELLE